MRAATSAFTVSSPSEGGQSTRQMSQRAARGASALSSRWRAVLEADHLDLRRPTGRRSREQVEPRYARRDRGFATERCRSARRSSTALRCAWPTPSPVEAFPWGSRSTSSTRHPIAASAVARLIAVVVLPTPPFDWPRRSDHFVFALTPLRRRSGSAIGGALFHVKHTLPARSASASSDCALRPFGSAQTVFSGGQVVAISRNFGERRHRPAGDHIESPDDSLDFRARHLGSQTQRVDTCAQEFGAEAARLDQGNRPFDQAGDHNSRQAGARADVHPGGAGRAVRSARAAPNRGCAAPRCAPGST